MFNIRKKLEFTKSEEDAIKAMGKWFIIIFIGAAIMWILLSYLLVSSIVWLICWLLAGYGAVFSWGLSLGVWLILLLIKNL